MISSSSTVPNREDDRALLAFVARLSKASLPVVDAERVALFRCVEFLKIYLEQRYQAFVTEHANVPL